MGEIGIERSLGEIGRSEACLDCLVIAVIGECDGCDGCSEFSAARGLR